jgi:hypothetical protein
MPYETDVWAELLGEAHDVLASAFEGLLMQTGRKRRPRHEPPPSWNYAAAALPLDDTR